MTGNLAVPLLALLGLIVGSFANVVIARVPAGGSILTPGSACPRCGHPVRAYDNIPVLSWLILRGKCRDCAAPISLRYPAVELLTAAGFALVPLAIPNQPWLWPAALWLAFVAVALSIIDLEHGRLPNALTYPSAPVTAALLTVAAAATGNWDHWRSAALGGLALTTIFVVLFVIAPRGMGVGDIKLAPTIGMALGWGGWQLLAVGTFAMFLIGGLAGLAVIAVHRARGQSTKALAIPFGPYMFAGLALAATVGAPVYEWYMRVALMA